MSERDAASSRLAAKIGATPDLEPLAAIVTRKKKQDDVSHDKFMTNHNALSSIRNSAGSEEA